MILPSDVDGCMARSSSTLNSDVPSISYQTAPLKPWQRGYAPTLVWKSSPGIARRNTRVVRWKALHWQGRSPIGGTYYKICAKPWNASSIITMRASNGCHSLLLIRYHKLPRFDPSVFALGRQASKPAEM